MTLFRRITAASTVATFVLVTIGGIVRATKSGLGCGDNWPHCPGEVNRALLIESSHRFVAGIVIVLIAGMVFVAHRRSDVPRHFARMSLLAFALVMSQALLGAIVVWLELEAVSVVLHLGTAMALLALLIHLWVRSAERPLATANADVALRARFAAGAVLILLLVGSYVTGREAGYVFPDWPLMNEALVPDLGNELYAIHFLHRVLAAVVGAIVLIVSLQVIRRRDELAVQAKLAHSALGLFAVEVLLGALNVFTELNAAVVAAHLAVGAAIWGCLVGLASVSLSESRAAAAHEPRRSEPALEASAIR